MAKDDDLLPKKKVTKPSSKPSGKSSGAGSGPSAPMLRLMRITRGVGVALGGFVTLVGVMSLVGIATDNVWARLVVGLLVVVGLPAFLADRLLKRTNMRGGLGTVVDVFAIVLLGFALVLVAAEAVSRPLFTHEGDRWARSGSTGMARAVYFLAGVSPTFPSDKAAAKPAGSGSASASASASASGAK